ncbi:predicted protein [Sclerotinia sclerotiorum 1980 UF-70]|uniref:Uncharacterized protein n=1 Tax=Sclerotinia sclerotiorum (strain ATCC 18683 / 1980 / Ss-1) TaxID=665079 RepID=A7F0N4_SCLS1|nr:predicted protein [Sclerotinia sclerotiorum 1980 UF-70]EDN95276.1 predicted protein [Sclerotinia sclerotiorum 1980 UF-70]
MVGSERGVKAAGRESQCYTRDIGTRNFCITPGRENVEREDGLR